MFSLYRLLRLLLQPLTVALGLPPHSCRFTPSCSFYCEEAVKRFGPLKGGWLCFRRVARCRPGIPPGHDPVPQP